MNRAAMDIAPLGGPTEQINNGRVLLGFIALSAVISVISESLAPIVMQRTIRDPMNHASTFASYYPGYSSRP
ncbi:hypothetical protein C163_11435 [Pseudomonas sp. FGI182]|nr:hypothetical protein C163_11435 [Pseudomonas sp. FGI182]